MRRFVNNSRRSNTRIVLELSSEECMLAEKTLIRRVQEKAIAGHRKQSLTKIGIDNEKHSSNGN